VSDLPTTRLALLAPLTAWGRHINRARPRTNADHAPALPPLFLPLTGRLSPQAPGGVGLHKGQTP
jgi:hypothetical protein